jgi:hypothetical protein
MPRPPSPASPWGNAAPPTWSGCHPAGSHPAPRSGTSLPGRVASGGAGLWRAARARLARGAARRPGRWRRWGAAAVAAGGACWAWCQQAPVTAGTWRVCCQQAPVTTCTAAGRRLGGHCVVDHGFPLPMRAAHTCVLLLSPGRHRRGPHLRSNGVPRCASMASIGCRLPGIKRTSAPGCEAGLTQVTAHRCHECQRLLKCHQCARLLQRALQRNAPAFCSSFCPCSAHPGAAHYPQRAGTGLLDPHQTPSRIASGCGRTACTAGRQERPPGPCWPPCAS